MSTPENTNGSVHPTSTSAPAPVETAAMQPVEMVTTLQGWATSLELGPILSPKEMRLITWSLNVPTGLVEAALATVEKFPDRAVGILDPDSLRARLERSASLATVAKEARSFIAHLDDEVRRLNASASSEAWFAYDALRSLSRSPAGAPLRESVRGMHTAVKEMRARQRRRRAPAKSEVEAQAAPIADPKP